MHFSLFGMASAPVSIAASAKEPDQTPQEEPFFVHGRGARADFCVEAGAAIC